MNRIYGKYSLLTILFVLMGVNAIFAQSYKKDSLQIKAYTEINYKNSKAIAIKLKKVFCDYCTSMQIESIGEEALRRANIEKYYPENKLENGKKKLAIYIRISKKDFASINENTKINIKFKE